LTGRPRDNRLTKSYLLPRAPAFIAALFCLALSAACKPNAPAAPLAPRDGPPNILFISLDSLRADRLSCYGGPHATSPNLDKLAAEGTRFAAARAQTPWTLPSHITMMTGLESGVHAMEGGSTTLNPAAPTIAETLADRGFRTAAVACAPYLRAVWGFDHGFEWYDDRLSAPDFEKSHQSKTAALAVDAALARIDRFRGQRWFVFLHIWDVHYDYTPPRRFRKLFVDPLYRGRYDVRDWDGNGSFRPGIDPADFAYVLAQYDAGIAWVDSQLGRLFAALKQSGEWSRTAIVVTADHGEEFLEHGGKGHGHSLFDELLHVPLIVKNAGAPQTSTVDCPVGLIDIYPTLAELGGADPALDAGPGVSLAPLLRDPRNCDPDREFFFETTMGNIARPEGKSRARSLGLLKGRWKYVVRYDYPPLPMLFDLAADPGEKTNLYEVDAMTDEMRDRAWNHQWSNLRQRAARSLARDRAVDPVMVKQLKQLGYLK
jgi:arylsulfatase A-like enzyme